MWETPLSLVLAFSSPPHQEDTILLIRVLVVALVAYSGISGSTGALRVDLQLKTGTANWALVGEANSNGGFQTCSLHSTLDLLKGDQVRLYLTSGTIYENTQYLYTNYVGWLIEDTDLTV
jgi:hypothetical protein